MHLLPLAYCGKPRLSLGATGFCVCVLGVCGAGFLASMFPDLRRQLLQVSKESDVLNTDHEDTGFLRNVDKQTLDQRHSFTCHKTQSSTKPPRNPQTPAYSILQHSETFSCPIHIPRFTIRVSTKALQVFVESVLFFVRPQKVLYSKFTETPEHKILRNLM